MRLIQKARPPANSEIRLTPEKEEGNIQKTEDSKKNKTKKDIYFAVDNVNDPDFGQNGFLCADQFKSGDCLPLLNDNIEENFDLPKLDFTDYEDLSQIKNNDSFDNKKDLNVTNDILSKLEEGRALEPKGFNTFMPLQIDENYNKKIEKENLIYKQNNIGTNTITSLAPSIVSNTTTTTTLGNRPQLNYYYFQHSQQQNNNILTQQNNLQQIQDREQLRNVERKRRKLQKDKGQIIKPQDQPGYVGNKDIDVIMKTMGFEEQQPSQQQQNQKSSQKANSPGNGGINNINSIISSSSINNNNSLTKKQTKKQKNQKLRPQQQNKKIKKQTSLNETLNSFNNNDNKIVLNNLNGNNNIVLDEEEEMDVEIELDMTNNNINEQNQLKEDANEENVKIEINENNFLKDQENELIEEKQKEDEGNNKLEELKELKIEKEEIEEKVVEELKEEERIIEQNEEKNENNKIKWTSSKLEEKKRLWKNEIDKTPLIKRIPKNILTSLGWTSPITIKSPFINNQNEEKKINFEQVNLIWKQKPAPEYLLEKTTFIEYQKFINKNNNIKSKNKSGGGGGGHYRHNKTQRKQMTSNNRRNMQ